MGKSKTKDRSYITMKEWVSEWGGKSDSVDRRVFSRLPFNYCAIGLQPFETPVCTADGFTFELANIVPYVKKHRTHPVTGAPLSLKELIRLNFFKNAQDEYHCPVTFKVFTDNVHIVAIKPTGNVMTYEAVELFNIKPKNWLDLVTGEKFTRADIIHLQDPAHVDRRDIKKFYHMKHQLSTKEEVSTDPMSNITTNPAMNRVFAEIKKQEEEAAAKAAAQKPVEEQETPEESARKKRKLEDPNYMMKARHYSNNATAASFTSSAVDVSTQNKAVMEEERRQLKPKKKGYVRLKTNLGDLNIELHCDKTPKTCENFIRLCDTGYYNNVKFHRNIPGFMIQGGDPNGTGRGGDSYFGGKFEDEIRETLRHNGRGVVSMANSGPNTNGSQFFICYGAARHLDDKHTVFGRVVGGLDTLKAMERTPVDKKERPLEEIIIQAAFVFADPYAEMLKAEADKQRKVEKDKKEHMAGDDETQWYSDPKPLMQPVRESIVGKYISSSSAATTEADAEGKEDAEEVPVAKLIASKKQKTSQFGDFSGW
eukprot:c2587_g1_i1.p1 GENE.c2587_g1_i1~~c2587_g1_i1.p1  ORF type:complete len:538 (-),score=141.87 c2587_g1_i1:95-1708(-)